MTIRVLIVDDEPLARRGIRQRLRAEQDVDVVGECGDGTAAIDAIATLAPDLVFLDIQMPELGGFDVIETIGAARMPVVIFVTAYDEHALRAFDVHALDYVLKPIDGERFGVALQRARETLARKGDDLSQRITDALRDLGQARRYLKRVAIKSSGRVTLVDLTDVDRLEAAGNYVEVHAGGKKHLLRETLTSLESRLDPEVFVRVSRASIVRADRIRELRPMFNGDSVVVLQDGAEVSASRRYRSRLDALIS
jgi:two-component system, LytTR family, response regulator